MIGHDAMRDRQAQPGAAADFLRREKRFKNIRQHFRRHAWAVVFDQNPNEVLLPSGGNLQTAGPRRLGQCVQRIAQQVYQDLLDLVGIGLSRRKLRIQVEFHFCDRLWRIQLAQFRRTPDDFVQVHGFAMNRLFAGKRQEIADEFGGAVAFEGDFFQVGAGGLAQGVPAQDQLQVALDDSQRTVQLVRNAGNHLAKRRELLRLPKLLFEARALGQFAEKKLVGRLAVETDRRAVRFNGGQGAVAAHEIQMAVPANRGEPFRAGLRHRLRLGMKLAEIPQPDGGITASDSEQTFGGLVQLQHAQVFRVGDDDAFARLIEQTSVAFLGGKHFLFQEIGLRLEGADFLECQLVRVPNFFQHQDDHANGDEELKHGGDETAGTDHLIGLLKKRVGGDVASPEAKSPRHQAGAKKRLFFPKAVEAPRRCPARRAHQRKDRQLRLQQAVELINAQPTPDKQKGQKERQLRRPDSLVEKPGATREQEHRRRADTALLQHNQLGVFLFVLQRNAKRQPKHVKKQGNNTKTEE